MRKIGIALRMNTPRNWGYFEGIGRYAEQRGDWRFYMHPQTWFRPVADPAAFDGAGWLGREFEPALLSAAARLGQPVVELGLEPPKPGMHAVCVDHQGLGRDAADHLLQLGFAHFGFYARPERGFSRRRFRGLGRRLQERGLNCTQFRARWDVETEPKWAENERRLIAWLRAQPKPFAVVAVSDHLAVQVLEACVVGGLRVPRDVAVLGLDNDETLCSLTQPKLSSVVTSYEEVGYRAAERLDRLLNGETFESRQVHVSSGGAIARGSTDTVASPDPIIADALRYIRSRAAENLTVERVLEHVGASRRTLEYRFREHLRCSPAEAIRQARLQQLKNLLIGTDLPLQRIVRRAGFNSQAAMTAFFRRHLDITPQEYRRIHHPSLG